MPNIFQILQGVKNPQAFIQNVMGNNEIMQNPMAKNAVDMYQKGNISGLKEMAQNLCKEKGTTPEAVQKEIMNRLGMM